jgi:hypothetical protein
MLAAYDGTPASLVVYLRDLAAWASFDLLNEPRAAEQVSGRILSVARAVL